jgi:hypothetical protein
MNSRLSRLLRSMAAPMQLTLCCSHKVTGDGLAQQLQAGHVQQLALVRCKGVGQARLRQLRQQFPDVTISENRREDESTAEWQGA